MEIAGRGVPPVTKKFQDLIFQMSGGLKCSFSLCGRALACCLITVCDNHPFLFLRIAGFSSSVKGHSSIHCSLFHLSPGNVQV